MFKIKGGMPFIEKYPKIFRLIVHNKSLDEIMAFGDAERKAGKVPMVKLPSPTFGGELGSAWDNHADPGNNLLIAIPTHIDGMIVDYKSTTTPIVPKKWEAGCSVLTNKKRWILWEQSRADVYFYGTKTQFVNMFKIDPDFEPDIVPDPEPDPEPEPTPAPVIPSWAIWAALALIAGILLVLVLK